MASDVKVEVRASGSRGQTLTPRYSKLETILPRSSNGSVEHPAPRASASICSPEGVVYQLDPVQHLRRGAATLVATAEPDESESASCRSTPPPHLMGAAGAQISTWTSGESDAAKGPELHPLVREARTEHLKTALVVGDVTKNPQLTSCFQKYALADYFDWRGQRRYPNLSISVAAKLHSGNVANSFGSVSLSVEAPAIKGKDTLEHAKCSHKAAEVLQRDREATRQRNLEQFRKLDEAGKVKQEEVHARQQQMLLLEIPECEQWLPPGIMSQSLLPAVLSRNQEREERKRFEKWNMVLVENSFQSTQLIAAQNWTLECPEIQELERELTNVWITTTGLPTALGVSRGTFCQLILDLGLVDQDTVPYCWAVSVFDQRAQYVHVCNGDPDFVDPHLEGRIPLMPLVSKWDCVDVINIIIRRCFANSKRETFMKRLKAVRGRLKSEWEQQERSTSHEVKTDAEDKNLSDKDKQKMKKQAAAIKKGGTVMFWETSGKALQPQIWESRSPSSALRKSEDEKDVVPKSTENTAWRRNRLISSMLVEPEVLQLVEQHRDLFGQIFSCYTRSGDGDASVGDEKKAMNFTELLQFCHDFHIIPHIASRHGVMRAFDAATCLAQERREVPTGSTDPYDKDGKASEAGSVDGDSRTSSPKSQTLRNRMSGSGQRGSLRPSVDLGVRSASPTSSKSKSSRKLSTVAALTASLHLHSLGSPKGRGEHHSAGHEQNSPNGVPKQDNDPGMAEGEQHNHDHKHQYGQETCVCGNIFMNDSLFCRKCGKQRPHPPDHQHHRDADDKQPKLSTASSSSQSVAGARKHSNNSLGVVEARGTSKDPLGLPLDAADIATHAMVFAEETQKSTPKRYFGVAAFVETLCRIAFAYLLAAGNTVQLKTTSRTKMVWFLCYLHGIYTNLYRSRGRRLESRDGGSSSESGITPSNVGISASMTLLLERLDLAAFQTTVPPKMQLPPEIREVGEAETPVSESSDVLKDAPKEPVAPLSPKGRRTFRRKAEGSYVAPIGSSRMYVRRTSLDARQFDSNRSAVDAVRSAVRHSTTSPEVSPVAKRGDKARPSDMMLAGKPKEDQLRPPAADRATTPTGQIRNTTMRHEILPLQKDAYRFQDLLFAELMKGTAGIGVNAVDDDSLDSRPAQRFKPGRTRTAPTSQGRAATAPTPGPPPGFGHLKREREALAKDVNYTASSLNRCELTPPPMNAFATSLNERFEQMLKGSKRRASLTAIPNLGLT